MTRVSGVCVGMVLLALTTLCASAASPKRVLILDPFGRDVAPFNTAVSAFRTTLARELGEPVDIYEIPLDLARFGSAEGEGPLVAFLEGRMKSHPVDLVVPIGGAGAQFAGRYRERLFPDIPVLGVGSTQRLVPNAFLQTNATLVAQNINLPGMVEDILQVRPQTTNIVVVFGASALERFWVNECRREFQSFTNRVGFTWLNDLSLDQIVERCAALPPRSFILHGLFVVDAAGIPCERNEALRRLHQVANAPLFGYFASEFGLGPIGGRLYQDSELGARGARTAIRILRGERPESIPPQVFEATAPVFDWRELQRWGVREASLPAGSVIRFRQPGFWERYRWPIAGTVLFCLLQAALIVGLLVNRAKRRQGEAEATLVADISSKFVNLPPSEVDRELMDAERRICQLIGLDLSALWQWTDGSPGFFTLTHFYGALEGPQPPERMNALEYFPWFQKQMLAGRTVHVSSMEELPAEATRDRETFRQFSIKSSLVIPLSVGGEPPIGSLSLNTTRAERDWPDALVKRLQLVAQIFANAIARKRAEQTLRESEKRFRDIAVNLPGVVYQFYARDDGQRGLYYVAGGVREVCGLDPDPLDTFFERFAECVAPEDRQRWLDSIEQAVRAVRPWEHEVKFIRPGGEEIYIRGFSQPQRREREVVFSGVLRDITERKRADAALLASEERFRALAESALVGIYVLQDGKYAYVNPAMARVFGYSVAEMTGMSPREIVQPCDQAMVGENIRRRITGEVQTIQYEVRGRHKDGSTRDVEVYGRRLEMNGRPALIGTLVDITERKQADAELKKKEERFRQVAETVGDFLWEVDMKGLYTFASPSVGRILGYTPEELVGKKHFYDLFDPSVREELKAAAFRVFADRQTLRDFPNPNVSKSGKIVHLETSGVPMLDSAGNLIGYRGADSDVTERKREEEVVRQSEERLRLVLEANSEGVWDWNIPSGKAYFSPRYSRMLGYEPEEFARDYASWKALVHPDDLPRVQQAHQEHFEAGKEYSVEFRMRKKTGDWCWIRGRGTVVERDTEGRPIRMVGTHQDITERKEAEAELLRHRSELAHVARVSTMGELAASVAHELNQPLGAILANAEAAEIFLDADPPALDDLRAILADIRKDDERAGEVIRRMRALLRKRELERQPLEINSLAEDVLQLVSGDAALRGVSLTADLGPVLPKVTGDGVHLQQVLLNLILNGMDAVAGQPREQRRISVRTRLDADRRVELAVFDSGHGIEPDKLPRLFQPFYTTKPNGMGMGLSIARTIIEAHGGRIWAENNASGGAIFRFTLPACDSGKEVVSHQ